MSAAVRFLQLVEEEVVRAETLHMPLNSHHEAYAVIQEEVDEYWGEVKLKASERSPSAMLTELIQTAAMACRAATNLGLIK